MRLWELGTRGQSEDWIMTKSNEMIEHQQKQCRDRSECLGGVKWSERHHEREPSWHGPARFCPSEKKRIQIYNGACTFNRTENTIRSSESKSTMEQVPSTDPRTPFEVRSSNLRLNQYRPQTRKNLNFNRFIFSLYLYNFSFKLRCKKYLQTNREHHSEFRVQSYNGTSTFNKTENTIRSSEFKSTMESIPTIKPRTLKI